MATQDPIERGVALFQELIGAIPELEEEFESSLRLFLPLGAQATGLTQRRHLEWFLFERPSNHLGGVPVEVLWESWRERAGPDDPGKETFLQTVSGVFEVTSTEPGALWIQDLFALGEYPIDEPDAAQELGQGDLLVGRLFPVGDGLFRMSPAVMCFRDARLIRAVREDLARMRAERRGVLRIEQLELERLFFSPQVPPLPGGGAEIEAPGMEALQEGLLGAGLDAAEANRAIERVRAGGSGSVVTEILNELAFASDVDIEEARRLLISAWASQPSPLVADADAQEALDDPREALEAFDRGRAEGQDLEELFSALARSLGVGSLDDDEEDGGGADFPQVVGAMVEEFLWETEAEEGATVSAALAPARLFGRFAADQSVFENLGARDVLDYCARWLLDESGLHEPGELRSALVAFARFCAWCEERHGVALASALDPHREALLEAVPRLARLRSGLRMKREHDDVFEVVGVDAHELELRSLAGGGAQRVQLGDLREELRRGEIVRGTVEGQRLLPSGVYPGELRVLLELVRGSG